MPSKIPIMIVFMVRLFLSRQSPRADFFCPWRITFDGMVSCGFTKRFPISLHRLFYEPQTFANRWTPHALYHVLCFRAFF
jgi:hypothetical protein